uniref:chloroplastic import inner membrane translocase subunit HP30-1-like n=1 Tax=Erigeron canadensis TaxID=72917 RepID=UPI001CB8A647|nr:chloroplastic import inner membrane translocase subunit HP30-1-like [Erigeron canadensis]
MEKEKELEGVIVTGNQNPITELVTKWREYTNFLDKWTSKQSLPVKAAVHATTEGINYAGAGLVVGFWLNRHKEFTSCPLKVPWIVARKFAPLGAVPASIYTVMEGLTGKKDITAS